MRLQIGGLVPRRVTFGSLLAVAIANVVPRIGKHCLHIQSRVSAAGTLILTAAVIQNHALSFYPDLFVCRNLRKPWSSFGAACNITVSAILASQRELAVFSVPNDIGCIHCCAQNEHPKLQCRGFDCADGVVQTESEFRRAAEKERKIGRQWMSVAPLPRMPRKAGERDGMRNEVQHPMAEHQEPNDHTCTVVTIDARSQ